ncbi:arginase [Helicobacter baculiformis]|uniref:Arginase n=1 Tax=Helicobacter baculiformis TaxID=427351 RepID=A0ABV7ZH08_9HELI|nr:arginase [Helicobacter baculiformis]
MILVSLIAELGASKHGSNQGVQELRRALIERYPEITEHMVLIRQKQCALETFFRYAKNFEDYYIFCRDSLIPKMHGVFKSKNFPLILSSEHSNVFGILQSLRGVHPNKKIGVLYLDAHADIHTAYDSDTGHLHGMPLGMLINAIHSGHNPLNAQEEYYWKQLCSLGIKEGTKAFDPQHLVYFGVRSTEKSEDAMIATHHIPLFRVQDIQADMQACVQKAQTLLEAVDLVYLSLDVDIMDGKLFRSTGVRENNGLSPEELKTLLELLLKRFAPKLAALEITEYNPEVGIRGDKQVLLELLDSAIGHLCKNAKVRPKICNYC